MCLDHWAPDRAFLEGEAKDERGLSVVVHQTAASLPCTGGEGPSVCV